jgi:hypothetical protein
MGAFSQPAEKKGLVVGSLMPLFDHLIRPQQQRLRNR